MNVETIRNEYCLASHSDDTRNNGAIPGQPLPIPALKKLRDAHDKLTAVRERFQCNRGLQNPLMPYILANAKDE